MSRANRRVSDEDDVAQSVFVDLCCGAEAGRLEQLANRDDLWWFLLASARQKIVDRVRSEGALKRGMGRVQSAQQLSRLEPENRRFRLEEIVDGQPNAELLAMVEDEKQRLLGLLRDDLLRQVACLRMDNHSIDEIADAMQIAPRSVKRKLGLIRDTWANEVQT